MRTIRTLFVFLALAIPAVLFGQVNLSISIGPPPLPVFEQKRRHQQLRGGKEGDPSRQGEAVDRSQRLDLHIGDRRNQGRGEDGGNPDEVAADSGLADHQNDAGRPPRADQTLGLVGLLSPSN